MDAQEEFLFLRRGEDIHGEVQILEVFAHVYRRGLFAFVRDAEAGGLDGEVHDPEDGEVLIENGRRVLIVRSMMQQLCNIL